MEKKRILLILILTFGIAWISPSQSVFTRHLEVIQPAGYTTLISDIQPLASGDFVVAGYTMMQPSLPGYSKQLFRMTIDSAGIPTGIWSYTIPVQADPVLSVLKITSDGGLFFSCSVVDTSTVHFQRMVCKLTSSGAIEWSKVLADTLHLFLHNVQEHIVGADTSYRLFGNVWNLPISNGKQPAVFSIDRHGNNSRVVYFGTWTENDFYRKVIRTADNGFLLMTGNSIFSSQTVRQYSLYKISEDLQQQWSRKYIPDPANTYLPTDLHELLGKGYLVVVNATTSSGSASLLHRTDANGLPLSAKEYGQIQLHESSALLNDSTYVIPGFNSAVTTDPVFFNFDSLGNYIQSWQQQMDSTGFWSGEIISCPADSGLLFFGPGYLLKTDAQASGACGTTASTQPAGVMGQLLTNAHVPDHHTAVTCLSTDSVFLVADTVLIQTVVACGASVGQFPEMTNPIPSIRIHPSPANDWITVQFNTGDGERKRWEITDLFGRFTKSGTTFSERITVPVSDLPSGEYLLSIETGGRAAARKFLIQH